MVAGLILDASAPKAFRSLTMSAWGATLRRVAALSNVVTKAQFRCADLQVIHVYRHGTVATINVQCPHGRREAQQMTPRRVLDLSTMGPVLGGGGSSSCRTRCRFFLEWILPLVRCT